MASRQITLTREAQQPIVNKGVVMGYHFKVTAVAIDMPSEVFMMNRRPLDPDNAHGDSVDDFAGICTPEDLQNLPINAPILPNTLFRSAVINVKYDTQEQGDDAWNEIQLGVNNLRVALNIMDNLNVTENVQFGP